MKGSHMSRSLLRCFLLAAFLCLTCKLAAAADTRLSVAAMNGDMATVQSLLNEKADVNAAQGDGTTALHWAAYRDDVEMTRALLQAGGRNDVRTRLGDITPLYMAAKNGNATIVDLLIKAGAPVD